jgi:hypothetical protein
LSLFHLQRFVLATIAVALAGPALACGGGESEGGAATGGAYPEECIGLRALSDGRLLAAELLSEGSGLFLASNYTELAAEIELVLARVRALEPAVSEIRPLPDYSPAVVSVGLEGELSRRVYDLVGRSDWSGSQVTGFEGFDELNRRLGLRGMRTLGFDREVASVGLCLDETVNLKVATERYARLEGIRHASLTPRSDGPDVAVRPVGLDWYVAVREASGDCLAGCLENHWYYFIVSATGAVQISEEQAADKGFARMLRSSMRGDPDALQ